MINSMISKNCLIMNITNPPRTFASFDGDIRNQFPEYYNTNDLFLLKRKTTTTLNTINISQMREKQTMKKVKSRN
jgi:hypothetical protein